MSDGRARVVSYLVGPELYWLAIMIVMHRLTLRNVPPTPDGNAFLEHFWYILPLVLLPLGFAAFLVPGPGPWWLLLRLNLATLIGLAVTVTRITGAIVYKDSRTSGVGMGWIMSLSFGLAMLAICDVVAAVTIWWRGRGRS